jgi:hypothetical protein
VPVSPYAQERLAHLLRLLRPAPAAWIARAQQIVVESTTLTDHDLAHLERKLESDASFRDRFDADPVAAAEAVGMQHLARALEQEIRGLVALAERIANDPEYRVTLQRDPGAALRAEGMPATSAEQFLGALAIGDETVAKLPEVVAHEYEPVPNTARLRMLLLTSSAVVRAVRSTTDTA